MLVFWEVMSCGLAGRYERFGGTCFFHIQGVTTKKTHIDVFTAVRTSNLTQILILSSKSFSPPTVALESWTDPGRLAYRRFLELFRHMVGLLGRVISPSQGLYLQRTTQHRKTRTNIHALSWLRTHDPSNQPTKTHASDRTATVAGIFEVYISEII
jgi:hypothetical protein